MEQSVVEIFSKLGRRMACGVPQEVVVDALHANPWFSAAEIESAARSIAHDMLTPDTLSEWLFLYPTLPVHSARNVLIIMAGNIPFVGMQDLICVLAAGHRAVVKLSSKDSALMSWVVAELKRIAPALQVTIDVEEITPDAVISMGGGVAAAAVREKYAGVPMLVRGNRSSLAVLTGNETAPELTALVDDVLAYSGLGCRNVSFLFVPRGYDFGNLQSALSALEPTLGTKFLNGLRQARALLRMNAVANTDAGSCLLVDGYDFSGTPSVLNYSSYDSPNEVRDWIMRHESDIQCIACRDIERTCDSAPAAIPEVFRQRTVNFGQTQHPRLTDYPDGCDTMQFLSTI